MKTTSSNFPRQIPGQRPRLLVDDLPEMCASPEEAKRLYQEHLREGNSATFVKFDPKTGKPPVLTIIEEGGS
jgi:hypothetical protein